MLALLLAAAAAAAARIMSGRRCAGGGAACAGAAAEAMEPAARELFEACRNGDVERVKRLVTPEKVNSRDTAGRKSTPLHFAAGNPGAAAPLRLEPNPTCAPGSRAPLPGISPRGLRAEAGGSVLHTPHQKVCVFCGFALYLPYTHQLPVLLPQKAPPAHKKEGDVVDLVI